MFLSYIHNFRGIALLYIVAGHSLSAFNWQNNPALGRLTQILLGNGTVFFVFIAGYLFQYLSKNYNPRKYFFSKLTTVLLPYFLISIPAIVFFVFFQQREFIWEGFYENPRWLQILDFYLTGSHLAPLWFIPMISLFYLISPILILWDKKKWPYLFLPLLILLSYYVPRGGSTFLSFVHFFSAYVYGMFLSHYRDKINNILIKPIVLFLSTLLFILLAYMDFFFANGTFINFIRKLLLCGLYIGFLLKLNIKNNFFALLASTSFGVFFIHSYVIAAFKILEEHITGSYLMGNVPALIFFILAVLLVCMGIITAIKKIFAANSKYLIGC